MKKTLCYLLFITSNILSMEQEHKENVEMEEPESPVFGSHRKKNQEIYEVFTPVNVEERNIVLDINDPEVQKIIHKVVSASIHEAFKTKELEQELARKKRCCDSSAKVKAALIMAAATSITGIITIILNLK